MGRIKGHIANTGNTPSLYVRAYVYLPRFKKGRIVDFLLDTGASRTALHPADWLPMASRRAKLTPVTSALGIGGSRQYAIEPVMLFFVEEGGRALLSSQDTILVALPIQEDFTSLRIPSLLGMDVIGQGSLQFAAGDNSVYLDLPGTYLS